MHPLGRDPQKGSYFRGHDEGADDLCLFREKTMPEIAFNHSDFSCNVNKVNLVYPCYQGLKPPLNTLDTRYFDTSKNMTENKDSFYQQQQLTLTPFDDGRSGMSSGMIMLVVLNGFFMCNSFFSCSILKITNATCKNEPL